MSQSHRGRRHYNHYRDRDHLRQEDRERDQRDAGVGAGTGRGRGGYHHHHSHHTSAINSHPPPFRHHYNHNQQSHVHAHSHSQNYSTYYNSMNNYSSNNGRGTGRRQNFMNPNVTHYNNSRTQSQSSSNSTGSSNSIPNAIPESVISAIHEATTLIYGQDESAPIIEQLMTQPFIALDCEGANLGKNGKLSTVQIGTPDGKAFIFDIVNNPGLVDELKNLLESENVVKAIHDCRNDSENFYCQYKISLKNVFDTQCAHTVSEQEAGRIGKDMGLNELCETYGVQVNYFKDAAAKKVYQRNPSFWLNRPMTPEMILYAASDVLTVANLYPKLKDKVSQSDHFKLLCTERTNYHRLGHYAKQDIKQREYIRRFRIQQAIDYKLQVERANNNSSAQNQNEGSKSEHGDEQKPK